MGCVRSKQQHWDPQNVRIVHEHEFGGRQPEPPPPLESPALPAYTSDPVLQELVPEQKQDADEIIECKEAEAEGHAAAPEQTWTAERVSQTCQRIQQGMERAIARRDRFSILMHQLETMQSYDHLECDTLRKRIQSISALLQEHIEITGTLLCNLERDVGIHT